MVLVLNKYESRYRAICDRAKSRQLDVQYEKHHVLPKSLGGSNSPDNIVRLTLREHYIAHLLLVRCTSGKAKRKMVYAAWQMSNRISKRNSRIYAATKSEMRNLQRGDNHPMRKDPSLRWRVAATTKARGSLLGNQNNIHGHPQSEYWHQQILKANVRKWLITPPGGEPMIIENLNQFCREHKLSAGNMHGLVTGKLNYYKGYRVTRA